MSSDAAVEYVAEYVALKEQIAALENRAETARKAALEVLDDGGSATVGTMWPFPGLATVTKVKGRESESLDRAVLARNGVDPALLEKATVRKKGVPTYRIVRDDGEEDDAA